MLEWLVSEPPPDVIQLPNALLASLAPPLRRDSEAADSLHAARRGPVSRWPSRSSHRDEALALIRKNAELVDRFTAVSEYYADFMARYLSVPREKIDVVPLGINLEGFDRRRDEPQGRPFTIGYLARIAPEKGLLGLCDAYVRFRQMAGVESARLEVAGYLAPDQKKYLKEAERRLTRTPGFGGEFQYRGALDRDSRRSSFSADLDVFSVPTSYVEPKGLFLLEAMACGVPVVQPRHGAFPEMLAQDIRRGSRRAGRPAEPRRGPLRLLEDSGAARRARRATDSTACGSITASVDRPTACSRSTRGRCAERQRRRQVVSVSARGGARCCRMCRCRSRRATRPRSWGRRAAARARFSTSSGRSSRRRPAP